MTEFVKLCPSCKATMHDVSFGSTTFVERCFDCGYEISFDISYPKDECSCNKPINQVQKRFCFVSDNDGHNYIIPLERKEEFSKYMNMNEEESDANYDNWLMSGFSDYFIDSMEKYSFVDPKILNK